MRKLSVKETNATCITLFDKQNLLTLIQTAYGKIHFILNEKKNADA
jgi:hypothetical protein